LKLAEGDRATLAGLLIESLAAAWSRTAKPA